MLVVNQRRTIALGKARQGKARQGKARQQQQQQQQQQLKPFWFQPPAAEVSGASLGPAPFRVPLAAAMARLT